MHLLYANLLLACVALVIVPPITARAAESEPDWAAPIRQHVAEAVARQPKTLDEWEAANWSPGRDPRPAWINDPDPRRRVQAVAAYHETYDDAYAPLRAVAARRYSAGIAAAFAVDTGIVPPAATAMCQRRTAEGPRRLGNLVGDPPDLTAERTGLEALRAMPRMAAWTAADVIATTCRVYQLATIAARIELATKSANAADVFGTGDKLAVPAHADGHLIEYDPVPMVRGAAADGLQITFRSGGWFHDASMSVTPFGRNAPRLEANITKSNRPDGTNAYVVSGLGYLPGLQSPATNVECLATSVQEYGAKAGSIFGPRDTNPDSTLKDFDVFRRCVAAKAAFADAPAR